jgi:hypothetical protein
MLKVSWRMPLLMSGIVILIGIVSIWRAEYIGMGEGLGTDGRIYAEMARDFRGQVFDRGVWNYSADYYFQRSMPSLLIHVVLSLFSSQITDQQLLWGFSAFNLLSLIVIVFAWLRISQHLGFSERGAWLGFFLLLINVPNALVVYYYPTITDISSMLMAMLLLQAFFERKHKLVFVMTALGAFVWPVILTLGAVFYLLPNQNEAEKKATARNPSCVAFDPDSHIAGRRRRAHRPGGGGIANAIRAKIWLTIWRVTAFPGENYDWVGRAIFLCDSDGILFFPLASSEKSSGNFKYIAQNEAVACHPAFFPP